VVLGHIPLHPDSPPGLLSTWVEAWVEGRARRLSQPGAGVRVADLIGGQISVTRQAFDAVGGFDARFTRDGAFGSEDVDFGYRLLRHGCSVTFNPNALSRQRYAVRPSQFLQQWRRAGRAAMQFARKHPEAAAEVLRSTVNRRRFRWLARVSVLAAPMRRLAVALVERGRQGRPTAALFFAAQAAEYCRGLWEAGGPPRRRPLRVLAYHAIAETAGAGAFAPYGVRPEEFRRQMVALQRAGYRFVSAEEVVHFLRGAGGLPRRPVLLTFDDCYTSVLEHALPILEARGIPAMAFAVTARLGSTNDWARGPGAPAMPLLDADGLRRLARAGVEIGAHSRAHRSLPSLDAEALVDEVVGSCDDLRRMGFPPARFFAYPYGEADARVGAAVRAAGCEGAFTVEPGLARPGVDRFRIPRVEILRSDVGWRFRWKVALGGPLQARREGSAVLAWTCWRPSRGVVPEVAR
jgi:peptidoglycan/xylan/chitin deacetylase (PgdA/CDA1 family)